MKQMEMRAQIKENTEAFGEIDKKAPLTFNKKIQELEHPDNLYSESSVRVGEQPKHPKDGGAASLPPKTPTYHS